MSVSSEPKRNGGALPKAGAHPVGGPPLRPSDPDWDDYWAHKVAEKARGKILTYFGLATVCLTVLGIKGIEEVKDSVSKRFEEQVAAKENKASERVELLMAGFQRRIDEHTAEVAKRKEEFMRITVLSPEYRAPGPGVDLALAVDLSDQIGAIGNQGAEGSTVGFSVAYALQAEIKRRHGRAVAVSARSIYVSARRYDEWPGENYEGTSVTGALKGLKALGAHTAAQWPYADQKPAPNSKPEFQIGSSIELPNDAQRLITELHRGKVPILSISATSGFDEAGKDGRVIIKSTAESVGGHSIAIVGYDPKRSEFRFANMWGTEWGDKGFGVIRDTDLKKIYVDGHVIENLVR